MKKIAIARGGFGCLWTRWLPRGSHVSGRARPGLGQMQSLLKPLLRRSVRAAMVVGALATAEAAAMETVRFRGHGDETTAPFTMEGPWRVEWRSEGRRLELILVQKGSEVESWLANLVGPGTGSTHYVQPGTYYFEVNAWGPWSLEVHPMAESGAGRDPGPTGRGSQ